MTHEQIKEKIAAMLAEEDFLCNNYHLVDEVASFCDNYEQDHKCNPTECWLRVFEKIEKGE